MRSNPWWVGLSVFALAGVVQFPPAAMAQQAYPSTFLWGTAMAAHQVEG
jgi:hypothetical protein